MTSTFATVAPAIDRCFGAGSAHARADRCERTARGTWVCTLVGSSATRWCEVEGASARELALEDDSMLPAARMLAQAERAGTARILAWRPGRRAVACFDDRAGRRIVKAFRRGRASTAARRHAAAARAMPSDGFRIARVLDVDETTDCITFECLDGRALDPLGDTQRMRDVGRRLAAMQRGVAPDGSGEHRRADELALLDQRADAWRADVGPLPPEWSETLERLRPIERDAPRVLAHRDLHDGQLLVTDDDIALIDFDLSVRAEAELDIGNLGAHLHLAERMRGAHGSADAAHTALLDGLRAGGAAIDPRALAYFECTTALRLALVYGLRPRWSALSIPLVALAQRFAEAATK